MTIALVTHPACLQHDAGPGHPEQPARLRVVLDGLVVPEFAGLVRHEAPLATREMLERAHPAAYVDRILAIQPEGEGRIALDADTAMSAGSAEAARLAAGGACRGVDLVMGGAADAAFVAVRPPGHHAEPDRAMGFCLFGNAAIAALHARAAWGLQRVAVVDFDVHHGNGTQAMAWNDPDFFFASSHQSPCYPGTGAERETGVADNVINAPLPPGSGSVAFRRAWSDRILPALVRFRPAIVIISAGFDAHRADPLAQLELDEADFAAVTTEILEAAAGAPVVSLLEGGYDLTALRASAVAHVRALGLAPSRT